MSAIGELTKLGWGWWKRGVRGDLLEAFEEEDRLGGGVEVGGGGAGFGNRR